MHLRRCVASRAHLKVYNALSIRHPRADKSLLMRAHPFEHMPYFDENTRARANPLSLGVWPFTLRFVLPRSWVGYPSRRPKGCGMQSPSGPKVYPKSGRPYCVCSHSGAVKVLFIRVEPRSQCGTLGGIIPWWDELFRIKVR